MKPFKQRNQLKEKLDNSPMEEDFFVAKKEIWFAHLWINIGYEQNGNGEKFVRPVLVLKKLGRVVVLNDFWSSTETTAIHTNQYGSKTK